MAEAPPPFDDDPNGDPNDPERDQIWTTNDGRKVKIRDMSDDHLRNCILYHHRFYGAQYPDDAYAMLHGDPQLMFPMHNAMRREADRRSLSWI